MNSLRLATRGSDLALVQSRQVAQQLTDLTGLEVELVILKTLGDRNQVQPLNQLGGKGVFVKELEQALLAGQVDFAVHSLKDMPARLPPGLQLALPPARVDPRDALVGPCPWEQVPPGAKVGTGSLRRQVQLKALRPDWELAEVRGNVPTRVAKWRQGLFPGGVVLACAGLARLGSLSSADPGEIHPLTLEECLPSPCQGILGLEFARPEVGELLAQLAHPETGWAMLAERAFLQALGGDCNLPAAGLAQLQSDGLRFRGLLWQQGELQRVELLGQPEEGEQLGRKAAQALLSRG